MQFTSLIIYMPEVEKSNKQILNKTPTSKTHHITQTTTTPQTNKNYPKQIRIKSNIKTQA